MSFCFYQTKYTKLQMSLHYDGNDGGDDVNDTSVFLLNVCTSSLHPCVGVFQCFFT